MKKSSSATYKLSDHFDGKKFFNPGVQVQKTLLDVIKWKMQNSQEKNPDWLDDNATAKIATEVAHGQAVLTFVNHASYLIQVPGLNILTDPIYSERASPVAWAGPKRNRAPGVPLEQLPTIHLVFVSHNHYDHLDLPTLKQLVKKFDPLFVTPLGNKKLISQSGTQKIIELDWWEKLDLPTGAALHMAEVQHWSSRTLSDANEALWAGFVLEASGLKIYFGADSGYGPHYKETYRRFGAMDISLLPIGAFEPRWFMREQHMDPIEAVQAHLDLQSRQSLGIHYGTFQLADDSVDRPLIDLQEALSQAQINPLEFQAGKNGETHFYERRQSQTAEK